jgi:hypothetical protein
MNIPAWVKPGIWGAVAGAVAISILGFTQMGWTTANSADRMAKDRAEAAVVSALVPFCVANAERDADKTKLTKVKVEQSSYTRSQLVSDSGWATMPGMTSPERSLASACGDKLQGPKS